jgi:hypothetical protein
MAFVAWDVLRVRNDELLPKGLQGVKVLSNIVWSVLPESGSLHTTIGHLVRDTPSRRTIEPPRSDLTEFKTGKEIVKSQNTELREEIQSLRTQLNTFST